ncbi:MCP four helix bundle domain-containing protein, partial [Planobispora takensis]
MTDFPADTARPVVTVRRNAVLGWFADRGIAAKVFITVLLMTVMAGVIGTVALSRMSTMDDNMQTMAQSNDKVARIGDFWNAMANLHDVSVATAVAPAAEKAATASQVVKLTERVTEAFEAYKAVAPTDVADVQKNIVSFEEAWKDFQVLRDFGLLGKALPAGYSPADMSRFPELSARINTATANLTKLEKDHAKAMTAEAADSYESARTLILVLLGAGLLLALALARLVSGQMVRSLRSLLRVLGM